MIFGWVVAITTGACSSSPESSATPVTRPLSTTMRSTAAPVRTSAPKLDAADCSALVTAPMPPSGNPHAPIRPPSPTSPTLWCTIT